MVPQQCTAVGHWHAHCATALNEEGAWPMVHIDRGDQAMATLHIEDALQLMVLLAQHLGVEHLGTTDATRP